MNHLTVSRLAAFLVWMTVAIPTAQAQLLRSIFPRIERICDDRLDNDSDGAKDCADADCATSAACIDADGSVLWDEVINPPSDLGRASGAVVDPEGSIYIAGKHGNVTKFASDGTEVWQSAENTAAFLTPGYYSGGIVYAGTGGDGKVNAINASDGTTLWSYQTDINPDFDASNPKDPPYGVLTAPVIGADGTLYIGAMSNYMYALKTDGTLLWSYKAGENIDENCPAIGADGTLYFSSGDGYIYAIKDE